MLMISILDLITSLAAIILGPWVVPSPEADAFSHFNRGTFTTCAAFGFLNTFLVGTWWYTGFLSLYFLLLVRYEWKERALSCYVEPVAHFISLSHPIATGIYALVDDLYNPLRILPGWCWYSDYPSYCSRSDSTVPCQPGANYTSLSTWVTLLSVYIIFVIIAVSMVLIILKVRQTELQLQKYDVSPGVPQASSSNATLASSTPHHRKRQLRRTRETAMQGLLYIAAFFASVTPVAILKFIEEGSDDPDSRSSVLFPFAILAKALSPMQVTIAVVRGFLCLMSLTRVPSQGFFNAYIYLHKRFLPLTHDGECFAVLRHVPLVKRWIQKQENIQRLSIITESRGQHIDQADAGEQTGGLPADASSNPDPIGKGMFASLPANNNRKATLDSFSDEPALSNTTITEHKTDE